jgi:hypothetical protein
LAVAALCAAAVLASALAASAQRPPITIPPAKLPPPAVADAPLPSAPSSPDQPAAAPEAAIQPAARALLPTNVRILRDSRGPGLVMYGALTGQAASATGVLLGVFAYSEAFDPNPALPLVLADTTDRRAQALFTATVRGAPVTGVAVAALGDAGGDVSVFYDYTESFVASFGRMQQALAQSGGTASVVLSPVQLGDGNRIDVPPGWRVTSQGAGLVELQGPLGESVSLGTTFPVSTRDPAPAGDALQGPCCDPVDALQAVFPQITAIEQRRGYPARQLTAIVESQPAPVTNSDGAFVLGNLAVGGQPYGYFALATAVAGFTDPWTFALSGVAAPQGVFAQELPMLLRISQSWSGNPTDFAARLRDALPNMAATQQILAAATTPRVTTDYNASAAWEPIIRAIGSDAARSSDEALIQPLLDRLSADSGGPWRIVPAAERK